MKVAFFLLVGALICSVNAYNWTIVDNDYATIALACRFQTSTNGWVVGGSGSLQPLLLHTTDGAKTFNNSGLVGTNVGALMSLDMANAQYGIAGALGFLDLPCGAYMTDGATWQQTHQGKEIICSSQDSVNTDGGKTMIIVGQWAEVTNFGGDGLQISLDAGSTWTSCPWNQGTEARYAWFSSANQGYVTGGTWPEESSEKPEQLTILNRIPKPLTRRLTYVGPKGVEFKQRPHSTAANVTGYQAILASASNNGKTFNTLINMTDQGVYFNQISCIDSQNCWACAEGINKTNGYDAAYIYQTSNGWKTWSTQLYVEGGSLVAITMLNSTYGWAGGALIEEESADVFGSPRSSFNGQFYLTTDGKTWVLNQQVRNFYVMDISLVDSTSAYAAGITSLGLSSLAKYS